MGLSKRFEEAKERMAKEIQPKGGLLDDILPGINKGIVIPIVSNSFRVDQIFREGADSGEDNAGPSIFEQLITIWAESIGYPMTDKENLARVAQYYFVQEKDDPHARTKYLEFLKEFLINLASDDPDDKELASRLMSQIQEQHFSEIVQQLDYPRFANGGEDPLRLLARLPLPVFITTSQSDFLERALQAEKKKPLTQVCFWSGEISSAKSEHKPNPDFKPDVTTPLVYHLYGLEDYPQTLVLSEDDYINFLVSVMEDTNNLNPVVPLSLRRAISESHLLLLGYKLSDWDFRVLFRILLKYRKDEFSPRGMLIQVEKYEKRIDDAQKSLEYLSKYFDRRKFDIEWNNAETFIQKLWDEWKKYKEKNS